MILVFASSKGGVGKSTACAALGALLADRGRRVHVMDLDQNRTLAVWARRGRAGAAAGGTLPDGLDVAAVEPARFGEHLREAQAAHDYVLVDLPGLREITLMKAIGKADLVIVPTQHSEPDVRQAMTIIGDVRDIADTLGRPVPYRVLFTKVRTLRTRVDQFIEEELAREGLARFATMLVDRIAYKEMFLNGVPAHRKEPGKGAGAELAALLAEIEAAAAPGARLAAAG